MSNGNDGRVLFTLAVVVDKVNLLHQQHGHHQHWSTFSFCYLTFNANNNSDLVAVTSPGRIDFHFYGLLEIHESITISGVLNIL